MRAAAIATALAFLAIPAFAPPAHAQAPAPQAIPVGVVTAALRPVNRALDFVGRVEAMQRVDITARITGYLEEVRFREGDTVKEGAPLYLIEPDPFKAAVQQAQGALVQAQGALANATVQRQRAEELVKTNATPVATRDQRIAEEQDAQGKVISADANLLQAKINLGYTEITAPISGRIGRTAVTKGNVVGPNSGPLTTIVSIDPMYVTFPVSQREFLRIQSEGKARTAGDLTVNIRFADGRTYPQPGRINFVNVTVDRATDTVAVRATVSNPDGALVDGQFVRVVVSEDKPEMKVVIPQAALIADQEGLYVFVVQDGKAAVKRVKPGQDVGTGIAIESGLDAGAIVVVQGVQSLRPGAPVVASPLADSVNPAALKPGG